jgi:hypothetical protein
MWLILSMAIALGLFLPVALAWMLVRLWLSRRSALRLGLIPSRAARWQARVVLRSEGGAYRSALEEIILTVGDGQARSVAVTAVRRARWVRDPQRHFPRLEDALHLDLDGETLVLPGSAAGFADVLALLERHHILEEVNVVLKR